MKQIHIWRHHVAIAHLDLVLERNPREPLSKTLKDLDRLGFDTNAQQVEVHDGVSTG